MGTSEDYIPCLCPLHSGMNSGGRAQPEQTRGLATCWALPSPDLSPRGCFAPRPETLGIPMTENSPVACVHAPSLPLASWVTLSKSVFTIIKGLDSSESPRSFLKNCPGPHCRPARSGLTSQA